MAEYISAALNYYLIIVEILTVSLTKAEFKKPVSEALAQKAFLAYVLILLNFSFRIARIDNTIS